MFEFKFDASELIDKVAQMGAAEDQMPFALSRALNDAVKDAREQLVGHTWPQHVTVRNSQFIGYALRMEFSTKYNLTAAIYDQSNGSVHLTLHDQGGVKRGRGRLAIPTKAVTLTAQGVRPDQLPRNLSNKVVLGNSIYQQQGRGKNSKLVRMFSLAASARMKADVPFDTDFQQSISASISAHFMPRMMEAMATRK